MTETSLTFAATTDDSVASWAWTFESGSCAAATTAAAECLWHQPGNYAVTVTMTTTDGRTAQASLTVSVTYAPSVMIDHTAPAGGDVTGAQLTFTARTVNATSPVDNWSWSVDGVTDPARDSTLTTSWATAGNHTVEVVVTLNGGQTLEAKVYLDVAQATVTYNVSIKGTAVSECETGTNGKPKCTWSTGPLAISASDGQSGCGVAATTGTRGTSGGCAFDFIPGSTYTLTASGPVTWGGACAGTSSTCTLTVSTTDLTAKSISADY